MKIEWMRKFMPTAGWGSFVWYPMTESGHEIRGFEIMYFNEDKKYLLNVGSGEYAIDSAFDTLDEAENRAQDIMAGRT